MKKNSPLLIILILSTSLFASNWTKVSLGEESNSRIRSLIRFNSDEAIVVGYDTTIYKTYNGGSTWNKINMAPFYPSDTTYGFDIYDASSFQEQAMIAVAKEGKTAHGLLFKSTDKGENWSPILAADLANDSDYTKNPACEGAHEYHFYDVNITNATSAFVYLGWKDSTNTARYGIFKTQDSGTSWHVCATPEITNNGGYIEHFDSTICFAGGTASQFFVSTDYGVTWTDYSNDDAFQYIWGIQAISQNACYILTSKNLYLFENGNFSTASVIIPLEKTSSQGMIAFNTDSVITYYKHQDIWSTDNASAGENAQWTLIGDTINYTDEYTRQKGALYNDTIYALGIGCMYKIALNDVYKDHQSGISTNNYQEPIRIYTHKDAITISASHLIYSIAMYNIKGEQLFHCEPKRKSLEINTQKIKKGIYIVKVNHTSTKVFVR